jgi:hypothetical protein
LQAGERDHRGEGAVERAVIPRGAGGGQHRGLRGVGGAWITGDDELAAALQLGEPGSGRAQTVGRDAAGRTDQPALPVETDEVEVAGDPGGDLGQPLGALEAHRPRRQGLQQHVGAFHPRLGGGRPALGGEAEVLAQHPPLALEGDRRLQRAQHQHRQQRRGEGRREADPDGARTTPG